MRRPARDIPFARDKVDQARAVPALRKGCVPLLPAKLDQVARPRDSRNAQAARVREAMQEERPLEYRKRSRGSPFTPASPPLPAGGR